MRQTKENEVGQKTKKILIVDDQSDMASLLSNYIKQLNYIPVIVGSVNEALKILNSDEYFMVISDVIMPGKNGFDLVRYLKDKYPQISIALISGYYDKNMLNMQKSLGIEKIYHKPIFLDAVKEMIDNSIKETSA